MVSYWIWLVKF